MTEISFKGKEFIYNHHLAVPHRLLQIDKAKGIGKPDLGGNLIIQGDNLEALKTLIPHYADKVDCIFIDPPYNKGNENWSYNDNVNAPMIKEWRDSNPIGTDDMLRHDKWCAMMWPRIRLLHELLAETGSLWMTIDDIEAHRAKLMLDEIFGEENFVRNIIWQKKYTTSNDDSGIPDSHDHIIVYRKSVNFSRNLSPRSDSQDAYYKYDDNDGKGKWRSDNLLVRSFSENGVFPIKNPTTGKEYTPPEGKSWRANIETMKRWLSENRIYFGKDGKGAPQLKRYLAEVQQGVVPNSVWLHEEVGHNDESKKELQRIFDKTVPFETPKPVKLLRQIIQIATKEDSLVLDSFAGSGTTAHAVLEANKHDGGNRKFILVEMEEHIADAVTAERVRRVVKGYKFSGKQKTRLHNEKITWGKLKNGSITSTCEDIITKHGNHYDHISGTLKNNNLLIHGEKDITEHAEGLGGQFTFCTLGPTIEIDKILTGEILPQYDALAPVIFHIATSKALDTSSVRTDDFYIGATDNEHVWMIYRPDMEWLKSNEAALTLSRAREFASTDTTRHHLVFAPSRFVSQKILKDEKLPVYFIPMPFALYRLYAGQKR